MAVSIQIQDRQMTELLTNYILLCLGHESYMSFYIFMRLPRNLYRKLNQKPSLIFCNMFLLLITYDFGLFLKVDG